MKCPKCGYLGFETGEQCKNCGYDFSLIAIPASTVGPNPDLAIRTDEVETGTSDVRLDRSDGTMEAPANLPLFNPDDADDVPLIALPSRPRPPLAVRRTPETPRRLRTVARAVRRDEPALDFPSEPDADARPTVASLTSSNLPSEVGTGQTLARSSRVGGRRVVAAVLDHAILLSIDAIVVYFTLRMSGLDVNDLRALPLAPIATFLVMLKLAYFGAFTAIGGQTIGKMAARIRVVGVDHGPIDAARAVRRTLASLLSLLTLGLGFVPAFVGAERRTLHDRIAHTRVVSLR